jgi:dihydrolipoamide dehydrogenase
VECEQVLAARRMPNTIGLGVRELGVVTEHGAIQVDERLQSSVPGIYAVGDVSVLAVQDPTESGSHKATAEGVVAAENAMGLDSKLQYDRIPYGLHTWPEVAWVGLTEERAEALGIEYRVGRAPLAINSYALILGQSAGVCKLIIGKYDKILGAHLVAPGATDLINTVVAAMLSEATVRELERLVPLHPSVGEILVDAAMDAEQGSLHLLM